MLWIHPILGFLEGTLKNDRRTILLDSIISYDRVVDGNALKIVVRVIVLGDEGISHIRNIISCIALAGDVDLPLFQLKGGHEVLPKANELVAQLNLVGDIWGALRETNTNRLLDVDHVCHVNKGVRVFGEPLGASLP